MDQALQAASSSFQHPPSDLKSPPWGRHHINGAFVRDGSYQGAFGQKRIYLLSMRFQSPRACAATHFTPQLSTGSLDKALSKALQSQDEHSFLLRNNAYEVKSNLNGTCIYLIGMMGSGKTTVGKIVAQALDYQFLDSDKLIEEAAGGMTVAEFFKEKNEESFRDAETEVLRNLSYRDHLVVATGGGIVVRPDNWNYLRHGLTVFLDVPLEALAERVVAVGTGSRPLLGESEEESSHTQALAKLSRIFELRAPFYQGADAIVSLENLALRLGHGNVRELTPTMIAIQVLEELKSVANKIKNKSASAA